MSTESSLAPHDASSTDMIINTGYDPEFPDRFESGLKGLDQETVDGCWSEAFGGSDKAGLVFIGFHSSQAKLEIARLMLWGGGENIMLSAMVGTIWAYESRGLNFRPGGDNGPMQITGWWRKHAPHLIVPGAFDPFLRKKGDRRPFTGDVTANIETGGNIITFLQSRHNAGQGQRLGIIPYMYGPGTKEQPRPQYERGIMSAYPQFEKFVTCLKGSGGTVTR